MVRMAGFPIAAGLALGTIAVVAYLRSGRQIPPPPEPIAVPARRPPPPAMFSPSYRKTLDGVLKMEQVDADRLERQLASRPEQWTDRLRLMAYYMRSDHAGSPEMRNRWAAQYLWLAEHQPHSEILRSPYGRPEPGKLSPQYESEAMRLWEEKLKTASDPAVLWSAAQFFSGRNEARRAELAKRAVAAASSPHYGRAQGQTYAAQIATALRSEDERTADELLREVEATGNPAVIEPVVWVLQREYISSVMLDREKPVFAAKAKALFAKLQKLNPDVDRQWVLPEVKPEMRGMLTKPPKPIDTAALLKRLRRLKPSDFPELPDPVVAVLNTQRCTIPQPDSKGKRNVIHGTFFTADEQSWAVLCSSRGRSYILVFRDGNDRSPEKIANREESAYAGGTPDGPAWFQREIRPVGGEFITAHYRAYGGPKPPPIRHQAIDDAFLEKASITWYRHNGKWLQLQGAD